MQLCFEVHHDESDEREAACSQAGVDGAAEGDQALGRADGEDEAQRAALKRWLVRGVVVEELRVFRSQGER